MNFLRKIALLSVLLVWGGSAAFAQEFQYDPSAPLPVDSAVKVGKLKNGFTYYIRQNKLPENKVELRLAVNAGSVLENDDQQGLAHFVEHMAFNGSKDYPGNSVVKQIESMGIRFGNDLNAYTSFDETVYMLPIPSDKFEEGMRIMENWAFHLAFEDQEIDDERGVILEEWRLGKGAMDRMREKFFPVLDDKAGERMQKLIEHCRDQLDSVGGVIECAIAGVPAGIGDPMFDCVESKISSLLFGIPAVKGVEFGLGFGLSSLQGSQANDPFYIRENAASSKEVLTATNHNGGILGGITDGMPVIFRAAIKPTPSIAQKQRTVNFKTGENVELSITGRHDPCIVRRAVPCIESAAAIALMDLMLGSDLVPKNPSRKGGSTR